MFVCCTFLKQQSANMHTEVHLKVEIIDPELLMQFLINSYESSKKVLACNGMLISNIGIFIFLWLLFFCWPPTQHSFLSLFHSLMLWFNIMQMQMLWLHTTQKRHDGDKLSIISIRHWLMSHFNCTISIFTL